MQNSNVEKIVLREGRNYGTDQKCAEARNSEDCYYYSILRYNVHNSNMIFSPLFYTERACLNQYVEGHAKCPSSRCRTSRRLCSNAIPPSISGRGASFFFQLSFGSLFLLVRFFDAARKSSAAMVYYSPYTSTAVQYAVQSIPCIVCGTQEN